MASNECKGLVAFVTGASRGIGVAIAERLVAAGAQVAAVARSVDTHPPDVPGTLRETVERIEARGGRAVAIEGDVLDAGSRARAVARCRELLGLIDILVNNAAQGPYRPVERFTAEDFWVTFHADVLAPLELSQLVAPDMRRKSAAGSSTSPRPRRSRPRAPCCSPIHILRPSLV